METTYKANFRPERKKHKETSELIELDLIKELDKRYQIKNIQLLADALSVSRPAISKMLNSKDKDDTQQRPKYSQQTQQQTVIANKSVTIYVHSISGLNSRFFIIGVAIILRQISI